MSWIRTMVAVLLTVPAAYWAWNAQGADPLTVAVPTSAGVEGCISCHTRGHNEAFRDSFKSHEYIRFNESNTWIAGDPHRTALKFLDPAVSPIAKKMADSKALASLWPFNKAPACLACHGMDLTPHKPLDQKQFDATNAEGISCLGCHGFDPGWQGDHYRLPKWRELPYGVPEKGGIRNLRDPRTQAELCASCHVGSAKQNKVITHDMYAAGHPPLIPFELQRYAQDQPQHWGTPFEKELKFFADERVNPPATAAERFGYHPAEQAEGYAARRVVVGAIVALEAEANLLIQDADAKLKAAVDKKASPEQADGLDWARSDCYACHHELKLDGARQKRGYEGAPGRPPLKAWNGALARAVTEHAKGLNATEIKTFASGFNDIWKELQMSMTEKPFGHARNVKSAAEKLKAWCKSFLDDLKKYPVYLPAETLKLRKQIEGMIVEDKTLGDPEAVMALYWAWKSLGGINSNETKIAELLPTSVRVPSPASGSPASSVGTQAGHRLETFNKFDAEKFRNDFREGLPH